jgi:UTP-glucose-1-phosphate uridylyltransferase
MRGKRKGPLRLEKERPAYKTLARAVLTPRFYEYLERHVRSGPDADEVPAIQALARDGALYGILLKGRGFDAGFPEGYAAAIRCWARLRSQPTK